MHPLAFLAIKSIKNGLRRALTSPRRLVTMVLVFGYYFWLVSRFFFFGNASDFNATLPFPLPTVGMPPLSYLEGVVFWVFAALSLLLLFPTMRPIRQADVDVLYPTPVDPKHVMLFRLAGDYAITLIVPLIFALIGLRPARMMFFDAFVKGFPHTAATAFRGAIVGWFLLTAMWVCIHNAFGLLTNRTGFHGDRIKRIAATALAIAVLSVGLSIWNDVAHLRSWDAFAAFSREPIYRCFFFGATAITDIVMGPLEGSWGLTLQGFAIILAASGGALWFAFSQIGFLYDQSTVRADARSTIRAGAVRGDVTALSVARAQQGKLKARNGVLSKMTVQGPACLIWKSLLIQTRASQLTWFWLLLAGVYAFLIHMLGRANTATGPLMFFLCGMTLFAVASSQATIQAIAVLRRVDVHKPLPITPAAAISMEVLACSVLPGFLCIIPVAAMFLTNQWMWAITGIVVLPSFAIVISASVFLVTLLFPDIDDPAQRGIRGIISLLGMVMALAPGILVLVLCAFLNWLPVGSILPAAINLAISFGICMIGGQMYANFNPTD